MITGNERKGLHLRKSMTLIGILLCISALVLVFATSYFDGTKDHTITADGAVVLSLNETSTEAIKLDETKPTVYAVTATVDKSASVQSVNATLKIEFENSSEALTLDNLTFELYDATGETLIGTNRRTGAGTFTVGSINQTTNYTLKIFLTPKQNDERYTASELKQVGGTMKISFTSSQGGN